MVVYSITNERSFDNTKRRIEEIQEMAPRKVVLMLVGNKRDEQYHREVPTETGREFAGT